MNNFLISLINNVNMQIDLKTKQDFQFLFEVRGRFAFAA